MPCAGAVAKATAVGAPPVMFSGTGVAAHALGVPAASLLAGWLAQLAALAGAPLLAERLNLTLGGAPALAPLLVAGTLGGLALCAAGIWLEKNCEVSPPNEGQGVS